MAANLRGFSGNLAHFALWRSRRTLFDVGEGAASRLEPEIARLRHVFVSHLHDDHVLGLRALVLSRCALAPRDSQPLTIYVPQHAMEALRDELTAFAIRSGFEWEPCVTLRGLRIGAVTEISSACRVDAFDAEHLPEGESFGFRVCELRKRLHERWREYEPAELVEIRRRIGDEGLHETYEASEFVYAGDTPLCPIRWARDAAVLWHEATFLRDEDRKPEIGRHAVLREVIELARDADVQTLILNHVSRRYREADVRTAISAALRDVCYDRPTFWIRGGYGLPVD